MGQYTYDEQGVTFYYFLLTFLACILIPTTFSLFRRSENSQKIKCNCENCKHKPTRAVNLKRQSISWKLILVVLGWAVFALIGYRLTTTEVESPELWDPFVIMGIPEDSSINVVKKRFRELALTMHPDKGGDPEAFIGINKAYRALTDPEIMENYREYGNPDGKQGYSVGLGLPKWLVEAHNHPIVLGFYAILFGLTLPYLVARWWYSSQKYTKEKILQTTNDLYYEGMKEKMTMKGIIELLSASNEFKQLVSKNWETDLHTKLTAAVVDGLRSHGEKFEKSKIYVDPPSQRALLLIYAHLLRIDVEKLNSRIFKEQCLVVDKACHLVNGMVSIFLNSFFLQPTILCMELSQCLVQATYMDDSPLLQLPYINSETLKNIQSKKKHVESLQKLLEMPEESRKDALRSLSPAQITDVINVAEMCTQPKIISAQFKVAGDAVVTPGSLVTFLLKLRAWTDKVEDEEKEDDEDDVALDNVDALLNGKKQLSDEDVDGPVAHASFFPREKKPYWWVFLADPKVNRIIVPPQKITNVIQSRTKIVKLNFQSPDKAGTYNFSLFITSDSYRSTDIRQHVQLVVHEPSDLPPEEEVDDTISEPDEDSVAGQMQAIRQHGVAGALAGGTSGKKAKQDSDSDSDTDDD